MGRIRVVIGVALVTVFLALIGCGGGRGSTQLRPGRPEQAAPEASGPVAQLPPPSALHGASYTQQDLYHWGSEYGDTLPHNLVSRDSLEAVLKPNWVKSGGHFADLAYATYQFQLDGFDLDPSVRFTWTKTGDFADGWIALANFQRNRWEWFRLPAGGVLAFDPAKNISDAGLMYVVVLLTGEAEWRLQEIWVGFGAAPGDWWMFGHDPQHTRRSPFTGPATNTLNWSGVTGGPICSSPAIGADGTVYVGSSDNNLYAINPDGSLKWTYTTGYEVDSSPAIGADGTVYVGSCDCRLYAINPDGSLKWSYPTGDYVSSSPAIVADGTVYVGSYDHKLYAINSDGSLKWAFTTGNWVVSSPAIGADGTVYVGSMDNNLYAINPDGTLQWSYAMGSLSPVYSSPAIGADGTVYVGSNDHKLYAINPDGSLKWSYTTESTVYSSPAIGADGTVYVGSLDGKLYAINPDGSLKWSYTTGTVVQSSPAIGADGTMYVGSNDDNLYAINPDGSLKWSYTAGNAVYSSPAIGPDGTVYVGSDDFTSTPSGREAGSAGGAWPAPTRPPASPTPPAGRRSCAA